jgi:hypothetical protein
MRARSARHWRPFTKWLIFGPTFYEMRLFFPGTFEYFYEWRPEKPGFFKVI